MKIALVGYGGIARALAKKLADHQHEVTIISRKSHIETYQHYCLNVCDTNHISQLNQLCLDHAFDCIINTIGMLSDNTNHPEKNLLQCNDDWLIKNVKTNVISSMHLAQAIQAARLKKPMCFIAFSARVGSISDNRLGGWYSYRMSKAMLNMFLKTLSIEWRRINKNHIVIGYHPGTVDTDLSIPFSANVPKSKRFTPEQAADYFYQVFTQLTPSDSGNIIDWDNKTISY